MPTGSLKILIADTAGDPVLGTVDIELRRDPGDAGAGGRDQNFSVKLNGPVSVTLKGIECAGGLGSRYTVRISSANFRSPYAFFQQIRQDVVNSASDRLRWFVKPDRVKDIRAPIFSKLGARAQQVLTDSHMEAPAPEDNDLLGAAGPTLYDAFGPLRKACFLNVARKASSPTSGNCWRFVKSLMVARQDRFFVNVDPKMHAFCQNSDRFQSAPATLHKPLTGFHVFDSFKTIDAHANLQVTFLVNETSGEAEAADIDLDQSNGLGHGIEVISNAVFKKRTNPYLIREFMLSADPEELTLDPGYRFVFA